MRFLPSIRNFGNFYRDTVPNTITTQQIGGNAGFAEWYYSSQRVTGINVPTRLYVKYTQNRVDLYYLIDYDSGGLAWSSGDSPASIPFTAINNGGSFIVTPNSYINFGVEFGTDIVQSNWLEISLDGTSNTIVGYCDINTTT